MKSFSHSIRAGLQFLRGIVFIRLCERQYRQTVLTAMAAYENQRGQHDLADLLEKAAEMIATRPMNGIGRKQVSVQVECECGATGYGRSGLIAFKPGTLCPDKN